MIRTSLLMFGLLVSVSVSSQDKVTNAFDDLQRKGTVKEECSIMRQHVSDGDLERLLQEKPKSGFFCFTEDRMHDIRLTDNIPQRWAGRALKERNSFSGESRPGEYFTFQVGVYSPYKDIDGLEIVFSDLANENGGKIKSSSVECINTDGKDNRGKTFHKALHVGKGEVQPLWIGVDVPSSAKGLYRGSAVIKDGEGNSEKISVSINVSGDAIENHGDNEGWRKTRLRWLNSTIGNTGKPTAPYTPLKLKDNGVSWLGGSVSISSTGLPSAISTVYDSNNNLSGCNNPVLSDGMAFVLETEKGIERFGGGKLEFTAVSETAVAWESRQSNRNFEIKCTGEMGFDGISDISVRVKAKRDMALRDIRLEVPYTGHASKYMMGLGHKGGLRPDSIIAWKWDVDKHQDKLWLGNVNAGLNLQLMDDGYVRPLVNIYYSLGKLNLPSSWGNDNKGGINILPTDNGDTHVVAYSGSRNMKKGEVRYFNLRMQITPVKPLNLKKHVGNRFYHSNSDLSSKYIEEAKKNGANLINIHHKKDIYPFINYPYYDNELSNFKKFVDEAHANGIGVRPYYTTRELTVKIPELWALRSLKGEVIHDGPGKDARTLIHKNGPNEWLVKNLEYHFIPAWYNAFKEGKYAGDMDISVITTPDSRWNNYYLAGLDWMVDNLGIDGIYIDDSALDRETMRRARRILDKDGKERLIDIHSWNHMNQWAGYANSLHIYTELLPYVDRTWIGEGFGENNSLDFWLVEMSGIPFGMMSETLDARNQFRGLVFGMTPRLPWSGNPVPLWNLFDKFGMKDAKMYGYWDSKAPVSTDNENLPVTTYINGNRALVVIANWDDVLQKGTVNIDYGKLGFVPSKIILPEVVNLQKGATMEKLDCLDIAGKSGIILLLEQ